MDKHWPNDHLIYHTTQSRLAILFPTSYFIVSLPCFIFFLAHIIIWKYVDSLSYIIHSVNKYQMPNKC